MKCSLDICNFLEEIFSLSHSISILFYSILYSLSPSISLHWSLRKAFLFLSPCYSLELCIQMVYLSFSPLSFASLLCTAFCKFSSDSHFTFLHLFLLGMVLIPVSCTMSLTSSYLWLSELLKPFLCTSVYSCHLFLIPSASFRSLLFCPLLCPSLHEMFSWYL